MSSMAMERESQMQMKLAQTPPHFTVEGKFGLDAGIDCGT